MTQSPTVSVFISDLCIEFSLSGGLESIILG